MGKKRQKKPNGSGDTRRSLGRMRDGAIFPVASSLVNMPYDYPAVLRDIKKTHSSRTATYCAGGKCGHGPVMLGHRLYHTSTPGHPQVYACLCRCLAG